MADIQKLLGFPIGIEYSLNFLFFLNWLPPDFFGCNNTIAGGGKAKAVFDGYCLLLIVFTGFCLLPLDKDCFVRYNPSMRKTVLIRIKKETREKLHSVKNPGQTLDGIITQLIDLWKKQKNQEAVAAAGQEK